MAVASARDDERCSEATIRREVAMALRYSTGAVRDYIPNGCGGPDLPLTIPEAQNFRFLVRLRRILPGQSLGKRKRLGLRLSGFRR